MNRRAAQNLAVSALLGLPVALFAHFLVFGSSHAAFGALHSAAVQASCALALVVALVAGITAARSKHRIAPNASALAVTAAAWLCGFELAESAHSIPVALCALAVLAATFIISCVVRAYTHTVAIIVQVITALAHVQRSAFICAYDYETPYLQRTNADFSLFSRPPPALS